VSKSPSSKGDRRLRVLVKEALGNIFIYRKGKLVRKWGELHAKDLYNSCTSGSIIKKT
jgi:hypothetical protein